MKYFMSNLKACKIQYSAITHPLRDKDTHDFSWVSSYTTAYYISFYSTDFKDSTIFISLSLKCIAKLTRAANIIVNIAEYI